MPRYISKWFHIHFFKINHVNGNNIYKKCRCGKRICQPIQGGYTPLDKHWLKGVLDA